MRNNPPVAVTVAGAKRGPGAVARISMSGSVITAWIGNILLVE